MKNQGDSSDLYRQEMLAYLLNNLSSTSKILDVGAGQGTWYHILHNHFKTIDALEVFEPTAQFLKTHKLYNKVIVAEATQYPIEHYKKYDCVILGDVLEHIPTQEAQKYINALSLTSTVS